MGRVRTATAAGDAGGPVAVAGPARPDTGDARAPRRLLLVTGGLGEGHHAAARAVEERAREVWPGVDVAWTDTLDEMGRGTAPAFRAIYAGCVRYLPQLYALYFWLLCRVRPFRAATRAVIGVWSARGLAAQLDRHRPDLVVATFPEGITGLARLRRQGRLDVPAVALVADPAPHPLWVDAGLDLHLVGTRAGAELLARYAPGARTRVTAPPVVRRFHPPEREHGRDRALVLVSCGSLAFGDVAGLCAAVLDAGADVLVSAGRDPDLRRRLDRLAARHPRGTALDVRTWIDDPAAATRECDIVVTNAGGATALEALACARPLLLVDPVPGHGRANAAILAAAGLARCCHGPAGLASAVRELADPARYAAAVAPLRARLAAVAGFTTDVAALARLRHPSAGTHPVRAQDAFFVAAETARVPQQVGAVIVLDAPDGGPPVDWPEHLAGLVRDRAGGIELLSRRMVPGSRPRWAPVAAPSPERHVRGDVVTLDPDGPYRSWDDAAGAFFGTAIDPGLGWELQAAHDPATGRCAVLARAHHALGDGLVITDALVALLTDEGGRAPAPVPIRRPGPGAPVPGARQGMRRVRAGAAVLCGLAHLAAMPPAGRSPLTGTLAGPAHRRIGLGLDGAEVRAAARAHGVGTTALVLAVLADAVGATFAAAGTPAPRVRAMVPITTRTRAGVPTRADGNRMAVVPLDLPTGPMPAAERVSRVADALARAGTGGRPEAAAAAVAGTGRLPRCLRGPVVRLLHGSRFFHLVASVMPGARRPLHVHGRRIREIHPMLPLAGGVGLAVGALHCGPLTCVGITADPGLVPLAGGIPGRLRASLRGMQDRCPPPGA